VNEIVPTCHLLIFAIYWIGFFFLEIIASSEWFCGQERDVIVIPSIREPVFKCGLYRVVRNNTHLLEIM